jgi:hypothetical protein
MSAFVIQIFVSGLVSTGDKRVLKMVSGGMICIKYLLFVFNLLFAVSMRTYIYCRFKRKSEAIYVYIVVINARMKQFDVSCVKMLTE